MKAKSQICKAVSELLSQVAKLPDDYEEETGLLDPIILDIKNAELGVDIILRRLNK